jgi:hypothetical protein
VTYQAVWTLDRRLLALDLQGESTRHLHFGTILALVKGRLSASVVPHPSYRTSSGLHSLVFLADDLYFLYLERRMMAKSPLLALVLG